MVVLDGVTRKKIDDVDLRYNLETPDEPGYVDIIQNTYGLSNVTPYIIPVNNPNGIRASNLVYDASTDEVTATLKTAYSLQEEFPIKIGDKLFVENVSVGIGSTGKGFDSQYYDYQAFEVKSVHQNLGNIGIVTYSMNGLVPSGEIPGNFDSSLSSATLVQEKFFPQFNPQLKPNIFNSNEVVKSESSTGPVQGLAFEWDAESKWLTVEAANDFEVGKLIESLDSGAKGIIKEIVLTFDTNYLLDYYSLVDNGWEYNTGFLNDPIQKVHDNEYYQSFSYAVKSRVFYDKWKDIVNTLNHTAGFQKFSQLQVESKLPDGNKNDMRVGLAGTVTGIINIQNEESLHNVNNFDLVTENLKDRSPASGFFSDEVTFQNRILIDYAESVGNRVLKIDDISPQFRSRPRPEPWMEVGRWDIANNKENRFIVYIRDRLFTQERQIMMVNALYDPLSGYSMVNQYGAVDTVVDLGQMDTVVDGDDAVLQFHPRKYEFNNYNVISLSYNLDELGLTTSLTAVGSTVIGSSTTPPGALVSVGSSVVLAGYAHSAISGIPQEVEICTVGTASSAGIALTTTPAGTQQHQLFNPRSAKIIVSVATTNDTAEYTEISMIHDGSEVEWHEYGQLSIHSRRDPLVAGSLGTFRPYLVGVGTTAALKVGYTPNAGIQTAWVSTMTVGFSSETFTGIGTYGLKNGQMISKSTSIASAGVGQTVGIASYINEFDGGYCIVQVKDTTNDRYEFCEVMMVDDDTNVYITEYGNLQIGSGAFLGIGTIGGKRTGTVSELTYTPPDNTAVEVKTFLNALKVEENSADPALVELQSGSIRSGFDIYDGTFYSKKTEFDILYGGNQIFERSFNGTDTDIVNLTANTITIPDHYFVSGEEVVYSVKDPGQATGVGTTGTAIGIAATYFAGVGTVGYVPSSVFIVKKSESQIQFARSAQDALVNPPVVLDLTTVGIGTSHSISSRNGTENTRALIAIDNVIQSPVVSSGIAASLSKDLSISEDIAYFTGITSFFAGDDVKVNNEIMKIAAVGHGGVANAVKVYRHWMGTTIAGHSSHAPVTKMSGDYNIIKNQLSFSDAPYGKEPPVGHSTSLPNDRDWVGITTSSTFSGRIFMRSGVKGSNYDAYTTNYVIDDVSQQFDGQETAFTLKVNKSNVTGIATQNGIVLVNGILQGSGDLSDYNLTEAAGISSVAFTGLAASVAYDVNNASVPVGGLIVSVGSTEGFGYQPLVGAGATLHFNNIGVVTSVSIGYSGSGYRVLPGTVGVGSTAPGGVGIATVVKVGVALSTTGNPTIQYIGTAAVHNGAVVSIAITQTDPIPGIGTQNPVTVGTGQSTFNAVIDEPVPYQDIPLWYSSTSPGTGLGTVARATVKVSQGSSIIDFEITNLGYGYREGQILTLPTRDTSPGLAYADGQCVVGIPTVSGGVVKEFQLTLERVKHDEFNMWTMGELEALDDFSSYFDGARKSFPITKGGEAYAIQGRKGSPIVIQDTIILTINDVLQVPGEGFTFNGGASLTLTEAPKKGDTCRFFFYRGTGGEDVKDRDIVETVKMGDDLVLSYDRKYNGTRDLIQFPRTVVDVKSSDQVDTNPYFGYGLGDDETEVRPVNWKRQVEDKYIDGRIVRKDRPLYEPNIFPTAYLIQPIGVGSTAVWVDNCKPFFDPENENPITRDFQKDIQIVNASSHYDKFTGAAGTCVVSAAGTVTSITLSDGGTGYSAVPEVRISTPTGIGGTPLPGIGTTARATATAVLTDGVVTSVTVDTPGLAYTTSSVPSVVIAGPTYVREENTLDTYEGDYGILSGVGIVTNISDANNTGVGMTYGLVFDMFIPQLSPLRNDAITSPDAVTVCGLETGHYFMINGSNIGSGVTSLDASGHQIGIGTTAIDNVYQVKHYTGITTVGFGSTVPGALRRIFTAVENWEGIQNTVGYSTLGQGITSSFLGEYSWGKLQFKGRMRAIEYPVSLVDGITGIQTGPQIKRKIGLKASNYVVTTLDS